MPYPSARALVRDWLRSTVFTATGEERVRVVDDGEVPSNLQHAQRFVVVAKAGSSPGDAQLTLDVSDVSVEFYARTQDRADDGAEQVRAELRLRFQHYTAPSGAFVSRVQTLAPPVPAPAASSAWRIATATYRITVHAAP
jgi:hypothetical protein